MQPAAAVGAKMNAKLPEAVRRVIEACREARAAGVTDLSGLSRDGVEVTARGEIELEFHAAAATGSRERATLEALGAEVLAVLELPPQLGLRAGLVTARVPFERAEAAAALDWVVAVTPASRGVTD
jgi:hypothetical protein